MVKTFDIGPDRTRVGIVVYSDEPKLSIALGDYGNRKDLVRAVKNISYLEGESCLLKISPTRAPVLCHVISSFKCHYFPTGNTRTGKAIRFMTKTAFNVENGARAIGLGYKRLAIVLTDGRAQDNAFRPASEAQNSGIQIYAVGVSFDKS